MCQFLQSLNEEQLKLCIEASNTSLSSIQLHQILIIYKRYYIALNRAPYVVEHDGKSTKKRSTDFDVNNTHFNIVMKKVTKNDPTIGLARVGSRAALNFSFAFLRRAWKLGRTNKFLNLSFLN